MKLPFYWIDAFTDRVFTGNPAGVIPLEGWLPDDQLQRIARENGLSETAFFVRTATDRFQLRWFTPSLEIDLCGHATLATASVVFRQLGQIGDQIVFDSRSGPLPVSRREDLLELDFPSRPAAPLSPAEVPADLLPGLGGPAPHWIGRARDLICTYPDAATVRALQPDIGRIGRIDVIGVIATALGDDCDFVSRFFAPCAGVPEDPVTGSAHCTLVPYWAKRLGRSTLHARQVSARGGELFCTLAGDRVRMAGHCALYLRGEISL